MVPRATFPKRRRIRKTVDFSAVFEDGVKAAGGPLVMFGRPNGLGFSRIGLSTPRRVGIAARRNRIRRMLREAFRQQQHDLPAGYDWVIVARPHDPQTLEAYQQLLRRLSQKVEAALSGSSGAAKATSK